MKVLDLFSGIGGFSLGLERAGMETVAFCEIEPFCQKVLKKHWANIPIYNDVTKLTKKVLDDDGITAVDVICGGYPCQPFSVAGKKKGAEDKRHLWPEMFRIIREVQPSWVIAENVEGHVKLGLDTVLDDLENQGYTCWTFIIPACAVGAPHQRNRVWIIANASSERCNYRGDNGEGGQILYDENWITSQSEQERKGWECGVGKVTIPDCNRGDSNAERDRLQGKLRQDSRKATRTHETFSSSQFQNCNEYLSTPFVCGVGDGIPNRTHRLKSLGNAVVPQIPELIGKAIMQYEKFAS